MFKPAALTLALALAAPAALAQTDLGFTGVDLRFGLSNSAGGSGREASGRIDFAVTEYHGLQFDLSLEDTPSGVVGTAGAHFYMTPAQGQKYGLFATFGDANDRSASYGTIGGEALFSLSDRTAIELRAGAGLMTSSDLDFVFAEADLHYDIAPGMTLSGGLTVSDFHEATMNATGYEARIGLEYQPNDEPWGFYAQVARDDLSGLPGASPETTFRAGIMIELGNTRRGGTETRLFRRTDPLRPMINRGLF
ncbi:MAG: hypothetical protein AAGA87_12200 [Pseudomonadota bacterium]